MVINNYFVIYATQRDDQDKKELAIEYIWECKHARDEIKITHT